MAATYTATAAQTFGTTGFFQNPPKTIEKGYIVRAVNMPIPFSASNTCTVYLMPIPKGCQLHDFIFAWDTAGTTTQFTANLGDTVSATRFITSGFFTASGAVRMYGTPGNGYSAGDYSYSVDATMILTVTAVASGSTTPAGNLRLTVMYSMDNNQKG